MTRSFLIAAAAFAAIAGAAQAEDPIVVSTKGFDLSTAAGAKGFYSRLSQAVIAACGGAPTNYLSSEELPFEACYKAGMDKAVALTRAPRVTALHEGKVRSTQLAAR